MNNNISRILRKDNHIECFQSLQALSLIDYSSRGYERWHWQYMENPFCLTQDPSVWIYNLDGERAGHLGTIPVALKAGSQQITAAWAVDFATLSKYRKRGIGRSLVEEAVKNFDLLLTVGQTDMSFNLFRKMGWEFLGYLPYYIKIFDMKVLIKDKIKNIFILNIVSPLFNLFFAALNFFKKPQKSQGIEVDSIDNFSEDADLFWQEICVGYKITIPRNQAYLNWKYDRQPNMRYVKFCAKRNGRTCGYIILRCVKINLPNPEGIITDIVVNPDDREATEALFFGALRYLKRERCSVVRCYINNKDIQRYLADCGFVRCKPYMRFLISTKRDNFAEITNLDNWFLSAGDCDIDR